MDNKRRVWLWVELAVENAFMHSKPDGRVNMMTARCAQHLLAPFTVDGACNRLVFETWMETYKRTRAATRASDDFG